MTRPILIATAGHVDHGKSTLVMSLTGTDPDRWAEEKARGITIDLGYAHLKNNDRVYSFIDVPGHEKFIHNMLAGVGSIDAVLFVIAADESVMPQTREHALALRWLGVAQVCVVITKTDLVDEDLLELLEMELDEWLAECGWDNVTRLRFSSKKPETTQNILDHLATLEKKTGNDSQGFRLSIDRVFTSQGSGAVVTGTVDRGSLSVNDKVTLLPSGQESRIRQLQLHGQSVDQVGPHSRAAINLSDIHYKDMTRGHGLYREVTPLQGRKILARVEVFEGEWEPSPKHEFHLHHLAAHLHARLLWHHEDLAAFELKENHGFWALDRGLIRDGSPLSVTAGFEVLLPDLRRGKQRQIEDMLSDLPESGNLRSWQTWFLAKTPGVIDADTVKSACGEPLLDELTTDLIDLGDQRFLARSRWEQGRDDLLSAMMDLHKQWPVYRHLPLNRVTAWIQAQKWPSSLWEALRQRLTQEGLIEIDGDRIKLGKWRPIWNKQNKAVMEKIMRSLNNKALPVADLRDFKDQRQQVKAIEGMLIWEKFVVNITDDLLMHHAFFNRIIETLHKDYAGRIFAVSDLKERFNISRKYAIPVLEYLDKLGCTQRQEDGRLWIAGDPPAIQSRWNPDYQA